MHCSLGGVDGFVEDAHDGVVSVHEHVNLVGTEGHLGATVLGEEHGLADLNIAGADSTVLNHSTGANGHDGTPVELFASFGGVEDDTGLGLGLLHGLSDEHAVEERGNSLEGKHFRGLWKDRVEIKSIITFNKPQILTK